MKKPKSPSSILAFCLLVGMSSVTLAEPAKDTPATHAHLTAAKAWRLTQLGDKPVENEGITIIFSDKSNVSGSGGVNSYHGDYDLTAEGQITFKKIIQTMRAIPDKEAMEREERFFRLLGKSKRANLSNETLVIECEDEEKKITKLVFVADKKE